MTFDDAFELVVGAEGNFTDNPRDNGNWTGGKRDCGQLLGTKYGISAKSYGERFLKQGKKIKDITLADAKYIYKIDFWGALCCDLVPSIHRYPLFSCAVNCGANKAIKYYQESLGVKIDGMIGPVTVRAAIESPDKEMVLERFLARWALHYDNLVARYPKQGVFLNGWKRRIQEVAKNNY